MMGPATALAVAGAGVEAAAEAPEGPAEHLMGHVLDSPLPFVGPIDIAGIHFEPTWHWVFFVAATLVVLVTVRLAVRSYARGGVPSGLGAFVEMIVLFVRDDIAEANIGHDGRKYTPLLCSFFFFILIAALLGLLPFAKTATGNVSVTLGLAFVSFVAAQWAGISRYGVVHHFTGMIPKGLPLFLVPIMIPVELLGMFARPFALTVRLFANMLAGHMVITTLLMLIPLMAGISTVMGIAMIPVSLALGLFIMFLEILVAFLQAFIFTLLSAIFIGMAAHPAH